MFLEGLLTYQDIKESEKRIGILTALVLQTRKRDIGRANGPRN